MLNRDVHAVFVVVAPAMGHVGGELLETPTLQILHSGGDLCAGDFGQVHGALPCVNGG